ncbi:tetratricopeptide repeat protein [Aestuariibacter halophilus]|uniref:Tetratricopeptide repeat protein n=1 Tax=Fluctibacter halophilus TaxID=226011 RepID=A0ABS8GCK4_9ALTE|nr:tetratricopeptide repeat protein [Aestuariibacter halophilus]MCC2618290.1 tetratricopeptide repeat protein [Aestuariibacter halophilus]
MKTAAADILCLNQWDINLVTGEITDNSQPGDGTPSTERIDPLGIRLIQLLAEHNGELVTKDTLMSALWPDTIVTEDALARCVSRVRKQLGDSSRHPRFIETLPKRGYRLIAEEVQWKVISDAPAVRPHSNTSAGKRMYLRGLVTLVLFVLVSVLLYTNHAPLSEPSPAMDELLAQADDYYHRINRQDNEMALELYQQAIAQQPDSALAMAGLANALVQRAIRLPVPDTKTAWRDMSLGQALADGRLFSQTTQDSLATAHALATKAVALAPDDPRSHKALGFVLSAQNHLQPALQRYQQALSLDPKAWDVLINMGELYELQGQPNTAISHYKQALKGMQRDNAGKAWRASTGALIGDKYLLQGNVSEAEIWYRHVLTFAPFDSAATKGLSQVLRQSGRTGEAERLCQTYRERVGRSAC